MSDTEDLRVGVFVCNCGLNIAGTVDCEAVAKHAAKLADVEHSVDLLFACSDDGQENIKQAIKEKKLNRVILLRALLVPMNQFSGHVSKKLV